MSKPTRFAAASIGLVLAVAPPTLAAEDAKADRSTWIIHAEKHAAPSAAYRWLEIMLETSARSVDRVGARPTIISREMAIVVTAMYDAWSAYDDKAVGTRLGDQLRRPEIERTERNKEIAIAHATHRALRFVYPEDATWIDEQMRAMGFDPAETSADPGSPVGSASANSPPRR